MKKIFILIVTLTSICLLANESKPSPSMWSDLASPITTDAKYIVLGGTLASSLVYLNKRSRTYRRRETYKDAKPFGDYGFIGNYLGYGILNAIYTGGAFLYGKTTNSNEAVDASEHMAKASLYSLGLTFALKKSISERRPGFPEDDDSFPSGHSSGAFSFASVITARHGWYWGGAAYSLASFISFSRINDDYHYLHDVIFGMMIGASYGWGVYYNSKKSDRLPYVTLIPRRDGLGLALSMDY